MSERVSESGCWPAVRCTDWFELCPAACQRDMGETSADPASVPGRDGLEES